MDSKEDFERSGSSVNGSGGVIAGEYPSCLSEGILPTPPPPPAWTFVTDDDNPPLGIVVDPEAGQPPSSSASEAADGASIGETVVIRSSTSTGGLADAGVTATNGADNLAGLLHARAAVLLGMAEADAVDAASRRPPPPPGEVESWRSLPPGGSAGNRRPPHDIPPLTSTWSARPPPQDEGSARQAFRDKGDDGGKGRRARTTKLHFCRRWWRLHLKKLGRN